MNLLTLRVDVSSLILAIGILVPLTLGVVALTKGRRFRGNRFLGVFLVLFNLHFLFFTLAAP